MYRFSVSSRPGPRLIFDKSTLNLIVFCFGSTENRCCCKMSLPLRYKPTLIPAEDCVPIYIRRPGVLSCLLEVPPPPGLSLSVSSVGDVCLCSTSRTLLLLRNGSTHECGQMWAGTINGGGVVPATREQDNRKLHLMWIRIRLLGDNRIARNEQFSHLEGSFFYILCVISRTV